MSPSAGDRDRLAADLTELIVDIEEERLPVECVADECSHADGEHPEPGVHCGDGKRLADRLIALGWTLAASCASCGHRLDTHPGCCPDDPHLRADGPRFDPPLDEERLARALRAAAERTDMDDPTTVGHEVHLIWAAAIAKAYRDDHE